jgi:hypothetical protein
VYLVYSRVCACQGAAVHRVHARVPCHGRVQATREISTGVQYRVGKLFFLPGVMGGAPPLLGAHQAHRPYRPASPIHSR